MTEATHILTLQLDLRIFLKGTDGANLDALAQKIVDSIGPTSAISSSGYEQYATEGLLDALHAEISIDNSKLSAQLKALTVDADIWLSQNPSDPEANAAGYSLDAIP